MCLYSAVGPERLRRYSSDEIRYDVDVEEASADKLVLKFGRWVGSDPHCCPSMEEHQVYVWSKEGQKYVLDRDYSTPMPKP